jgi:hypothetical protein
MVTMDSEHSMLAGRRHRRGDGGQSFHCDFQPGLGLRIRNALCHRRSPPTTGLGECITRSRSSHYVGTRS